MLPNNLHIFKYHFSAFTAMGTCELYKYFKNDKILHLLMLSCCVPWSNFLIRSLALCIGVSSSFRRASVCRFLGASVCRFRRASVCRLLCLRRFVVHRSVRFSVHVDSSCIGVTAAAVAVVEQKLCYTRRVFVLASKFPKFSENVTDFHRSR